MDQKNTQDVHSFRRKRQASECDGDPSCEFMPLSKRINNLHINSNFGSSDSNAQNGPYIPPCECRLQPSTSTNVVQCSLCNPNLCGISQHVLPDVVNIPSTKNAQQREDSSTNPEYEPDMDVEMNPHYYNPNKLLFSLHIERVKRHGLLFKPNKYDG